VKVRREEGREGGRVVLVLPELLQLHWQEFGSDLASALREVLRLVSEEEGGREGGREGGKGGVSLLQ